MKLRDHQKAIKDERNWWKQRVSEAQETQEDILRRLHQSSALLIQESEKYYNQLAAATDRIERERNALYNWLVANGHDPEAILNEAEAGGAPE